MQPRKIFTGLALTTALVAAGASQAQADPIKSETYSYSVAPQTIQVPANARLMRVELIGGSGGNGFNLSTTWSHGGKGADVSGWYWLQGTEQLTLHVGGAGADSATAPYNMPPAPKGGTGYTGGGDGGQVTTGPKVPSFTGQGGGGGGSTAISIGDQLIALAGGGGGAGGGDGNSCPVGCGGQGGDAGNPPQAGHDSDKPGHGGAAAVNAAGDGLDGASDTGAGRGPGGGGGAGLTGDGSGGGGAGGTLGGGVSDAGGGGGSGSSAFAKLDQPAVTTAKTAGDGSIAITFYDSGSPGCEDGAATMNTATQDNVSFTLADLCAGMPVVNYKVAKQPPTGSGVLWALDQTTGKAIYVNGNRNAVGAVPVTFQATSVTGQTQTFNVTVMLGTPAGATLVDQNTGLALDDPGAMNDLVWPLAGNPPASSAKWQFAQGAEGTVTLSTAGGVAGCLTTPNHDTGAAARLTSPCATPAPLMVQQTGSGFTLTDVYSGLPLGFQSGADGAQLVLGAAPAVWQLQGAPVAGGDDATHQPPGGNNTAGPNPAGNHDTAVHKPRRVARVRVGHRHVRLPARRYRGSALRKRLHVPKHARLQVRAHHHWHRVDRHEIVRVHDGQRFRIRVNR